MRYILGVFYWGGAYEPYTAKAGISSLVSAGQIGSSVCILRGGSREGPNVGPWPIRPETLDIHWPEDLMF